MSALLCFLLLSFFVSTMSQQLEAKSSQPLLVHSQGVGQIFRLAPPVYGVLAEPDRPMHLDISRTFTNYWARDKRYLIDDEMIDDGARWSYQFRNHFRIGLGFNTRRFAYTASDQVAISFHDLFFMGQDGRIEAGKNKLSYRVPDYGLQYSVADRDRVFSEMLQGDVTVPFYWQKMAPLQLALTLMSSFEMARGGIFPEGSQDQAWQLNALYPLENGNVFASLTQILFDQQSGSKTALETQQMGWTLGMGHSLDSAQELIAQFMSFQPVFRNIGQLSRHSYEIHLAYRYAWEDYALEATLIENIFWLYNTPDWGMCLGLRMGIQ